MKKRVASTVAASTILDERRSVCVAARHRPPEAAGAAARSGEQVAIAVWLWQGRPGISGRIRQRRWLGTISGADQTRAIERIDHLARSAPRE